MSDLGALLEVVLLLAVLLAPIIVGILLRRKFAPVPAAEGARPEPLTGAQKVGRLAGTLLLWGGVLCVAFMIVVALNFKGKL